MLLLKLACGCCRVLLEGAAFQEATVHPEGVRVRLGVQDGSQLRHASGGAGGEAQRLEVAVGHDAGAQDTVCRASCAASSSLHAGSS